MPLERHLPQERASQLPDEEPMYEYDELSTDPLLAQRSLYEDALLPQRPLYEDELSKCALESEV
jgi:hypothetical protein